jgi:hypothetical protein
MKIILMSLETHMPSECGCRSHFESPDQPVTGPLCTALLAPPAADDAAAAWQKTMTGIKWAPACMHPVMQRVQAAWTPLF